MSSPASNLIAIDKAKLAEILTCVQLAEILHEYSDLEKKKAAKARVEKSWREVHDVLHPGVLKKCVCRAGGGK